MLKWKTLLLIAALVETVALGALLRVSATEPLLNVHSPHAQRDSCGGDGEWYICSP
jgi:hypothetical protein